MATLPPRPPTGNQVPVPGGAKLDYTVLDQLIKEAEAARKRETERQARIATGNTAIDTAFAQFDPAFFDSRKSAFLGYYQPQLDDQFEDASDELAFKFARNGTLGSTMAGKKNSTLNSRYTDEMAQLLARANADVNGLKQNINNQKGALKQQLAATGDASIASNEALARTKTLYEGRPDYNPLGEIFAGIGDGIANYASNRNDRQIYDAYFGKGGSTRATRTVY